MNDALFMRGFQRLANAFRDVKGLINGKGTAPDAFGERFAFYEFEDEKARTVCFLKAMDACDVRMVEGGEDLGLTLETAHPVGIESELIGKDLDRDLALELRVASAIDLPHTAFSEQCR